MTACPSCQAPLSADGLCPRCTPAGEPTVLATQRAGSGAGGTWVGPYRLIAEVGRGGAGSVWRAWDSRHEREVALKLLAGQSAEARARFAREAEVLRRLSHPGLVPLLDTGTWGERLYLVMSFVPGRALNELSRGGELDVREAARIVRDAAQAVAHAHARGVVHRDLKPHNLLVDAGGQVKVVDFGVARVAAAEQALTRPGDVVGTVAFMPPEQLDPRRGPVDARSDVWALGATLHAALTGASPFAGSQELTRDILERPAPPPSARRPAVPPPLDAIVLRCLEKDPARRYAGAGELALDLERFLRGARPQALGRRPGRSRAAWSGVALGLLLAGVAAAWLLRAGPDEPGPPPDPAPLTASAAAVLSRAAAGLDPAGPLPPAALEELGRLGAAAEPALRECLAQAAARLAGASDELLLLAGAPGPDEPGWEGLTGLAQALPRARARDPQTALDPGDEDLLLAARARLPARLYGADPGARAGELLAAAQTRALPPAHAAAARLAAAALVRLGPGQERAAALGRLLRVEEDEARACEWALLLLELAAAGDEAALDWVSEGCGRWPGEGPWGQQVAPALEGREDLLSPGAGPEELVRRGKRRQRRGDVQGAREDFERAAARAPDLWEAVSRRGGLRAAHGDLRAGLADLDRAIELAPDELDLWSNRGVLRMGARDLAGALADLDHALARGGPEALRLRHRGLVLSSQGELEGALQALLEAAALRPAWLMLWQDLGKLHLRRGDAAAAEEAYRRALRLSPGETTAEAGLAAARALRGQ